MKRLLVVGIAAAALTLYFGRSADLYERPHSASAQQGVSIPNRSVTSRAISAPDKVAAAEAESSLPRTLGPGESGTSVGEYINPDRGADFSTVLTPVEVGEYIDPDRGADYTASSQIIEIGDYIDPDLGASYAVDPTEQLSIGAFIDPDGFISTGNEPVKNIGDPLDP